MKNVGFIGVGYMGYGIAKNILKNNNNLFVIANKNREPIERIVKEGAEEVNSFEDFANKNLDALFMCVTNTPIAKTISEKISKKLDRHEKISLKTLSKINKKLQVLDGEVVCENMNQSILNSPIIISSKTVDNKKNKTNKPKKSFKPTFPRSKQLE